MTDTDKLKRLKKEIKRKEFWRETRDSRDYVIDEICDADDYGAEERYTYSDWLRDAILALIAENERLKLAATNMEAVFKDAVSECDKLTVERDEAVALLRPLSNMATVCGKGGDDSVYVGQSGIRLTYGDFRRAFAFLARIDAAE